MNIEKRVIKLEKSNRQLKVKLMMMKMDIEKLMIQLGKLRKRKRKFR